MRLSVLLALILSVVAVSAAKAQSAEDMAALKRYVNSQDYTRLLVDAAVAGEAQAAPGCRDIRPVDRAEFTLFSPPVFAAAPYPVTGMWRDRLKIVRCGVTTYQNVVFIAQPDQPPQTALMLPGLSAASPQAQQQALDKAAAVARARARCDGDDVAVVDTRVDRVLQPTTKTAPNGFALDGRWQEYWQFRACGKSVAAMVTFSADGSGGTVSEAR